MNDEVRFIKVGENRGDPEEGDPVTAVRGMVRRSRALRRTWAKRRREKSSLTGRKSETRRRKRGRVASSTKEGTTLGFDPRSATWG